MKRIIITALLVGSASGAYLTHRPSGAERNTVATFEASSETKNSRAVSRGLSIAEESRSDLSREAAEVLNNGMALLDQLEDSALAENNTSLRHQVRLERERLTAAVKNMDAGR